MPCMGPDYSRERADEIAAELFEQLKNKHNILKFDPPLKWANHDELRAERYEAFRLAVHGLVELDAWEGF